MAVYGLPRTGDRLAAAVSAALIMLAPGGLVAGQPAVEPPIAARVEFLDQQVAAMRAAGTLDAGELASSLRTAFPVGGAHDLQLLLQAAVRSGGLDAMPYNSFDSSSGETSFPVVERGSGRVYHDQLFNALLGAAPDSPARDSDGKTALMYAAEANAFEVLRMLLRFTPAGEFESLYAAADPDGREYIDWCDKDGYTALMYASSSGCLDAVSYLINAGADPAVRCKVARFDALQLAQMGGHANVVKTLEHRLAQRSSVMKVLGDPAVAFLFGALGGITIPALLRFGVRVRREYKKYRASAAG